MKIAYRSLIAFWISAAVLFYTAFVYYPKWNNSGTEATISWDVSGYYYYLPAIFIYKDVKTLAFKDSIEQKYHPAGSFYQAFPHRSGNFIMKYACGQAVMYAPFFAVAHLYALNSSYSADGFSIPYQLAISLGNLLVAMLGLWFLRKNILLYFNDTVAAITILLIVLATNYHNYASIDGAMTHNYLFTLYAILIFTSIQFYITPSVGKAILIGFLVGLATLTRPTEIISALIPLLWGVKSFNELKTRFGFLYTNLFKCILAVITAGLVIGIQVFYWKYAGNEYFIYSYEDQGFSWLHPHIRDCLISYRAGWLVYTPVMLFALIGFYFLKKQHPPQFWATFVFSILFMYIAFAWDVWWYGGSLGQRSMVQCYAILAFPLAAFVEMVETSIHRKVIFYPVYLLFIYYNIWLTHAAHHGGVYDAGNMTGAYFWKVLFKTKKDLTIDAQKLLDTKEEFTVERKNVKQIYFNDFEADTALACKEVLNGKQAFCLSKTVQYSPKFEIPASKVTGKWLRLGTTFRCTQKEWDVWKMLQMILKYKNGDKDVKVAMIRVHRFLNDGETKFLFVDSSVPKKAFDKIEITFWNADSDRTTIIDDIKLETYDE